MTYKVLFLNPLKDYVGRLVDSAPEGFEVTVMPPGAEVSAMCREAADADFLISGVDVPEEVFRAAKNAKFIQYMSSGYGQLPIRVLNELGVPVAQMKTHSISVGEHAVTLMLTVLRRIPASMQLMRDGKWRQDLDEMLGKIADFYDEEVDAAVSGLLSLLEPLMIVFLGVVVGGMVVAMYLPIFDMINAVQ